MKYFGFKIVWWVFDCPWGYQKGFYDCVQHSFNLKLFAICWKSF